MGGALIGSGLVKRTHRSRSENNSSRAIVTAYGPEPGENGMEDGIMKCPCKRSKNLNWLKIDDVGFHLLAKGMFEGYTVWTSHDEKIGRKRSRTSHHRYCVREPSRVEEPVDLNAMLHDLAGENYQFYETTDTRTMNVEEAPNDCAKKLYKVRRNGVLFDVQNSENLEVFKYPIQSLGKEGTQYMRDDERELADENVLLNSLEVQPYLRKYQDRVMRQRPETTPQNLDRIVKSRFKTWFKHKVDKDEVEGPRFRDLLEGPVLKVMTFKTCQVNGYKFSTKSASDSGIVVKENLHRNNLDYYDQLQEIIRFIYQGCNHVYLFKCIWFDSVGNGVRIDKNRVITIDMTSRLKSNEIFILASQASQVYYAPSVLDPKAKIYTAVKSKSRPIDESIVAQNDIDDAFQEERSNASTSFLLFVDFAQYGQIPFIRREEEEEDEEDDLKDDEDENEGEEEISEGYNEDDDDDEDDDGFDDFE
ncbi:hypothetical protein AgCh_037034 [Apium graveolens]